MKSLRRIATFMKPYRWIIAVGLVTVILPVTMELVVPRALQFVIDQGIQAGDMNVIWQGGLIMLGAAVVGALATLGQGVCRAQLSQGIAYDLRSALFTHIQSFSYGNLDQMQTGRLMTRLSSDVDMVRLFSSAGLSLLLRALLMIFGSVVMLLITDWQLAIIMLVVLTLAGLLIRTIFRIASPLFMIVQRKLSSLNTLVQENLAGVRVVKAYVRERYQIELFESQNVDFMQENIKVGRLIAVTSPFLTVLTNLGIVALVWFGGMDVIGGRLSVGELVAFNNYLMIGMAPLMLLGNVLTMVARADTSAERVLEVLDTQPLIQPDPSPHQAERVQGRVVFEAVSFHYNGADNGANRLADGDDDTNNSDSRRNNGEAPLNGRGGEAVLDGVSFEVEAGQQVALLGATGAGKSTLVNLIPRFYDVTAGAILIDGVDVRKWEPAQLRAQVGMVLQQTTLFSGTIRENIAYGRPQAAMDVVIAAAKAAQAHDFIMSMPDGYDSLVEARGTNLSGGQRQRIAIARALLISPAILIMDDSTSAVDMETEYKIQEALAGLMASRTTFMIAQRITSVINADQIIILHRGRIAAQGTHQELLQSSSIYQEIYQSQLGDRHLAEPGLAV